MHKKGSHNYISINPQIKEEFRFVALHSTEDEEIFLYVDHAEIQVDPFSIFKSWVGVVLFLLSSRSFFFD